MTKIAFIGMGVMGYPMAGYLAKAGHDVTVYNRTSSKAEKWATAYNGKFALTPAEAVKDADFVMTCVGNDNDLRSVTLGPKGVFDGMKKGAMLVDHTTASALVARELYDEAHKRGFLFIDAPVSGGQAGAENGQLTIMIGGDTPDFQKAEPVLKAYAKAITHMGNVGSGQLTKMVNQICIAANVQGLAEALNFGVTAGLDMDKVFNAISQGSASSWQMLNRTKTMLADTFDFGFAVDWIRKDLGMCLDEARRNGAALPTTAIIEQFYGDLQRMGHGRLDCSSLIKRLKK